MSTFNASHVFGDSNEEITRHEPISPIPSVVDIDRAKARLGQRLFFDTLLSADNNLSCADCHQLPDGGDDNVALRDPGLSGAVRLNTPTIFNARFNFRQNWDGSAETLQQQIDMVVQNHDEFNNSWNDIVNSLRSNTEYQRNFRIAYADGINKENIIDAIVEYEKTLVTPNSRFDRYLRLEDSLSRDEIQGYALFKDLGCISCHQGINIGGNLFQKFGLFYDYMAERGDISKQDYGRYNSSQREMDKFVFKVPSLRNVAVTAPYFHDGSASTIDDAIRIMGKTQLGRSLNDNEIALIKSFLNTLTGEYNNRSLDSES